MSEQDGSAPPRGNKKIAGLPRNAVIIGIVTLVLATGYLIWRKKQSGSSTSSAADGTGTDYSGEISTLQSEYGDLANELAAMQGNGAGSGGSSGGGTPVIVGNGPTGTTGTTDTTGTTADGSSNQAKGTAPAPKPRRKPGPRPKGPAETDRHADHMAHLAHERHVARRRTGP